MLRIPALPLGAVGLMAGVFLSGVAVAADLDVPVKAPSMSLQDLLASKPDCTEATDQCRTCRITAGKAECSNIGVACQPQAWRCTVGKSDDLKPAQ